MVAKGRNGNSRKKRVVAKAKDGETRPALATLSAQHRKFVIAYLQHFNASKAALDAGYAKGNTRWQGHHLTTNPNVRAAIDEGVAEFALSKETVVQRFAEVFMGADLADFEDYATGDKTLAQLRADGVNTRVLKGVRIRRTVHRTKGVKGKIGATEVVTETRNVELNDPMRAGSEIARMLGYVIERHAHGLDMGWLAELQEMSDEQLLREAEAAGMTDGAEVRQLIAGPAGGNGGGR